MASKPATTVTLKHLAASIAEDNELSKKQAEAILGGLVGQMFNGTVQPLFGGFALFGAVTIAATLWAENGKLFTHPGDSPQLDPGAAHF